MIKKYKKGVTIFTPTYNRAKTLTRLYNSLVKQKDKNFEWLIVDDGSIDNTKELVNQFINDNLIDIRYIYQENHGKTYAYNVGVKNAKYNMFYCVDSDDYIGNDTVNKINTVNNDIFNDDSLVGIMGYKKNIKKPNKQRKVINKEKLKVSELYRKYHFKDEIALIYKTNILLNNNFPIIKGEKFLPEGYLYDKMDLLGRCYFLKEDIYYYEYLDDGYTNNSVKLLKDNIQGYILYSKNRLENPPVWQNRIKGAIQYNIANMIDGNYIKHLKNKHIILLLLTYIPSYLYYFKKYRLNK